jgi:predicted transposase YbfD/YdcC
MNPIDTFDLLEDPRKECLVSYELKSLVFITIAAVISGCETFTDIAVFAKYKRDWITKYVTMPPGKNPSHDIFGDLYSALSPDKFCECFIQWVSQVSNISEGELIVIDGKRLRGSYDRYDNKAAIHMVSAWASENQLVLGQVKTDEKSNEITAIPALLNLLTIKGAIISIDAMGCQKDIATEIRQKEAHYILALKGNQSTFKEQIEGAFDSIIPHSQDEDIDKGHGRIEIRKCTVIKDLSLIEESLNWNDLTSIIKIDAQREELITGNTSQETRFYISSCDHNAKTFNKLIRKHWSIENNLHWSLDVNFSEDSSRIRKGYADQNFSIIRRIALNMIKLESTEKISQRGKRKIAGYDDGFRERILKI